MSIEEYALNPFQAETLVKSLEAFEITKLLTPQWFRQRAAIEKLNLQAHQNVAGNSDEFITAALISFEKIDVLVHELIVIDIWKNKIAPLIHDEMISARKKGSLSPYLLYYHEATIVNLLEIVLYEKDAVKSLADGQGMIDLIDYCQRKINWMNNQKKIAYLEDTKMSETEEEQFKQQKEDVNFKVFMGSLTLLRYISDNFPNSTSANADITISPGAIHRFLDVHDTPVSLVYIIEKQPWRRIAAPKPKNSSQNSKSSTSFFYKYHNNQWTVWDSEKIDGNTGKSGSISDKICQPEAQIWLTLYNFLCDPECRKKYEVTTFRKDTISGIKKFLNETLIDQIPILTDLLKTVEEMIILGSQADQLVSDRYGNLAGKDSKKSLFIVQEVPVFFESFLRENTDFEEIANMHAKQLRDEDDELRKQIISDMSDNFEYYEKLYEDEPPIYSVDTEEIKLKKTKYLN